MTAFCSADSVRCELAFVDEPTRGAVVITPDDFAPGDYIPPEHAGYAWSLILGVGWLGIACGAVIVWLVVKARTMAKAHAREEKEMRDLAARPLSAGPHRVVFGRVELDEGDDVAIEIDINQKVHDRSSRNSRWHTWDETDRSTRKNPFYLVREDGEIIYVDPPSDVLVVDSLETKYPIDAPRTRIRVADVRRGEQFYVYGDLDRGPHPRGESAYRDGSGWILRSPRQRMLLATEAVQGRFKDRISFLYLSGAILAAIFVVFHSFITEPFLEAALFGTQTTGTVIDHRTWITTNKGNATTHYSVTVQLADGVVFTQDVSRRIYDAMPLANSGEGDATIAVLESDHSARATYLGFEPSILSLCLFIGIAASLTAMITTVSGYRARTPWYDRSKLNEHGGDGSWVEPRPQNPVRDTASK